MENGLTSRAFNWRLLVVVSYALVLYKLSSLFKQHHKVTVGLSNGLFVIAIVAVLIGGYKSVQDWRYNQRQQLAASHLVASANHQTKASNNLPSALAPKTVPSTVQPSVNVVASYQVAPNMPRYLLIPKLGIQSRVLSVGLTSDGAIGTPGNVFDTAWYSQSSLPGQSGASLIDGHISSWTSPGVFYNLDALSPGDVIEVQRGDGQVLAYSVVKTVVFGSSSVDMNQVLSPVNPTKPGLNLMSCYGSVVSGTNEFDKRIVVYASLSQ